MKTKKLILSGIILLFAYGCANNDELSKDGNTPDNVNIPSLNGTKWKLAAFVDVQTGKSIEPEPKECNKCYTLEFDSDKSRLFVSVADITQLNEVLVFKSQHIT